jgi:hypothetical protein
LRPSVELLDAGWGLRRLTVLDRSLVDLAPVSRLAGLEPLSIEASPAAELDLSPHAGLTSIAGPWSLIGGGDDDGEGRAAAREPRRRRGAFPAAEAEDRRAPRLTDIEPVHDVTTLRELELEACAGDDLRFLGIGDCGDIALLAPLAGPTHAAPPASRGCAKS